MHIAHVRRLDLISQKLYFHRSVKKIRSIFTTALDDDEIKSNLGARGWICLPTIIINNIQVPRVVVELIRFSYGNTRSKTCCDALLFNYIHIR